jgi:ubiquinone/menaquinone biosynthesis C-methylase UbiE
MRDQRVFEAYESERYSGGVHPRTAPGRVGAVAKLAGLAAAAPSGARVLELGCLRGDNLLAMAAGQAAAEFVGVDFLPAEIDRARASASAAGLANVGFVCADLLTFTPPAESFDYIICHGVFSWVGDDVKEAVLRICRQGLADRGVALVSYNTHPGWLHRQGLRQLLLAASARRGGGTRTERAATVLEVLRGALASQSDAASGFLRQEVEGMLGKVGGIFGHDELGPVNDPCYFLQFIDWATEYELAYVGESPWIGLTPSTLSQDAWQSLEAAGLGRLEREQLLDFLINRLFRASVLCRAADLPPPGPLRLDDLSLETVLRPDGDQARLVPDVELQFRDPGLPAAPVVLATRDAPTKAVLWLLGRASQPVAVADLSSQVRQLIPAESTARLEGVLTELVGRGIVGAIWQA